MCTVFIQVSKYHLDDHGVLNDCDDRCIATSFATFVGLLEGLLVADSSYLSRKKTSLVNNRLVAKTGPTTTVMAYSSSRPEADIDAYSARIAATGHEGSFALDGLRPDLPPLSIIRRLPQTLMESASLYSLAGI
jgi:hypothetical protein